MKIGDILVYRDVEELGDTVMVIDPQQRIAWGSHGWDGNSIKKYGLPFRPATGVQYQKIKNKPDWDRWDRKTMELKACWRYRTFVSERDAGRHFPMGSLANPRVCESSDFCGFTDPGG